MIYMIYIAALFTFFTAVGWWKASSQVRVVHAELEVPRHREPMTLLAVLTFPLLSFTGFVYMILPKFSENWLTYGVVVNLVNKGRVGKPEARAYLSRVVPDSPWQKI